ncbi:MAG: hypothetical protein KBC98_02305 [Candidatus Pacebacteria bacterium]|nr:hypothetical protein [Candidatus Paceibacterota bacterium]
MKNLILFICVFFIHTLSVHAQDVQIESVGSNQDITVPAHDIVLGQFYVIVIPEQSYTFDSCRLVLQGTTPQVISNLRFNRSDFPEYDPLAFWGSIQSDHFLTLGGIYNFPPVENDTTSITFTADIGINSLPILGSNILVSLQCSGSSLGHEEIVTNTEFGHVISISSISGIEEFLEYAVQISGAVGSLMVFDGPIQITDITGGNIFIKENGQHYFSPGMYLWEKETKLGISYGKVTVY